MPNFKLVNIDELDKRAIAWLLDCMIADARNEKVTRLSDFLAGQHKKDLTIDELVALNPSVEALAEFVRESKSA